ncbi:MAG: amidase domain-containing protein [Oscillospiraceae bacterium]|nr:amidase domain-containing protein [Oscillospiraceae bacterium]
MRELAYNADTAVAYARRWALSRNPAYYDFEKIGGDCTNFASQCIFAGAGVMNFTPVMGWYYRSAGDRTPSWSGVEYLYDFLVNNRSAGPYGQPVSRELARPGDIVQLGNGSGHFYHSPVITALEPEILVAAHTFDALDRPLSSYTYAAARFIHISGVRNW